MEVSVQLHAPATLSPHRPVPNVKEAWCVSEPVPKYSRKDKNLSFLPGSEPRFLGLPSHKLVATQDRLSRLLVRNIMTSKYLQLQFRPFPLLLSSSTTDTVQALLINFSHLWHSTLERFAISEVESLLGKTTMTGKASKTSDVPVYPTLCHTESELNLVACFL
jgi:hypothetical protein